MPYVKIEVTDFPWYPMKCWITSTGYENLLQLSGKSMSRKTDEYHDIDYRILETISDLDIEGVVLSGLLWGRAE